MRNVVDTLAESSDQEPQAGLTELKNEILDHIRQEFPNMNIETFYDDQSCHLDLDLIAEIIEHAPRLRRAMDGRS